MVDFSKSRTSLGFFTPQRFDADIFECEVRGTIPPELNGVFVRVGSQQDYPMTFPNDAPFNEDGYVNAFRFKDGRVSYRGEWIQTERLKRNRKARRQLFGYYRNPFTDDPSIRDEMIAKPYLRTVMNTSPIAHAGKLFALKEDSVPYQLDPNTLETIGPYNFGGRYKSLTFTAHPKIDPVTGEMICYGFEATGLATDDLWLYHVNKAGQVTKEVKLKVPYVSMVHDFAVSDKHIVIPVFPYISDMERLKAGKIHWAWDGSKPTYYGILPRDGEAKDIRWFKGPTRAIVHTANAKTVGNKVILEAPIFDGNPFPFFPAVDGTRWDQQKGRAFLRRITFDLGSKDDTVQEEIIFPDHAILDLVRIDDRFQGKDPRFVFAEYADRTKPFDQARAGSAPRGRINNSYIRFDLQTKKVDTYFAGPTHSVQEVEFIPRGPNAPEGDGWIMGAVNNYADMRTELVLVDSKDLSKEVARVILPFRSNVQVHGRYYSAAALKLA